MAPGLLEYDEVMEPEVKALRPTVDHAEQGRGRAVGLRDFGLKTQLQNHGTARVKGVRCLPAKTRQSQADGRRLQNRVHVDPFGKS